LFAFHWLQRQQLHSHWLERVAPVEQSLGAFHHARLPGQRPLGVAGPRKTERQFPIKAGKPTDNQVFDKLPSNPGCILTESQISTQVKLDLKNHGWLM